MNDFIEQVRIKPNEELLKMVYEFDHWDPAMLNAVETELLKRNILPGDIHVKKKKLVEEEDIELSKGRKASAIGQVVGWITIFGLLGIYMGYNYAFSKVKSKYTEKEYFKYDPASRKNGIFLFYIATALFLIFIFYKILTFND